MTNAEAWGEVFKDILVLVPGEIIATQLRAQSYSSLHFVVVAALQVADAASFPALKPLAGTPAGWAGSRKSKLPD
jgi:hypothetical protein